MLITNIIHVANCDDYLSAQLVKQIVRQVYAGYVSSGDQARVQEDVPTVVLVQPGPAQRSDVVGKRANGFIQRLDFIEGENLACFAKNTRGQNGHPTAVIALR